MDYTSPTTPYCQSNVVLLPLLSPSPTIEYTSPYYPLPHLQYNTLPLLPSTALTVEYTSPYPLNWNIHILLPPTPLTTVEYTSRYYPECECSADGAGQVCAKSGFQQPDTVQLVTSEHLQKITGDQDNDYYLSTANIYRLHRFLCSMVA